MNIFIFLTFGQKKNPKTGLFNFSVTFWVKQFSYVSHFVHQSFWILSFNFFVCLFNFLLIYERIGVSFQNLVSLASFAEGTQKVLGQHHLVVKNYNLKKYY